MTEQVLPQDLMTHYRRLEAILQKHKPMIVAFSGGVDSGLLAYIARKVLAADMKCLIAISPSLAKSEEKEAIAFLERHDIPFGRLYTKEMEDDRYRANTSERCYYCKSVLFSTIQRAVDSTGFPWVAYGANVDDLSDFRPGARAASEKKVIAPLAEAGFTKELIRETAKALGLGLWDKPAAPCLASRIPYDSKVTEEKLKQIEKAEAVLKEEGFPVCRVRHHGELARIEIPAGDHARVNEPAVWTGIVAGIKGAGFLRVELEPDGFRSGRLNDVLDVDPGA